MLFLPFQHVCMKVDILDLQFLAIDHAIAVFLIKGDDGYVLVESGPYSNFAHLKDLLTQKGVDLKDIKHVLLSHIHFDHAGAAWAFAEAGAQVRHFFPDACLSARLPICLGTLPAALLMATPCTSS